MAMRIFTIGHSTSPFEEFAQLLLTYKVNILVDVRSFPRSFANPQFNIEAIEPELAKHDIRYVWSQKLGGRRKGFGKKSKNTCWKNTSFRNYADYMETPVFTGGVDELIQLAHGGIVAIMCAESLHWRCHRSMISDSLKSKGVDVTHIFDEKHTQEHRYTPCARIIDGQLTYHQIAM